MGPAAECAVPPLVELARSPQGDVQRDAVDALGCIGPAARDAVPVLRDILAAGDLQTRRRAIRSLARIGGLEDIGDQMGVIISEISSLIQDNDPEVRRQAIGLAATLGPQAESLIPELVNVMLHWESEAGWLAAETLGRVGPVAMPALLQVLQGENRRGAWRAATGSAPSGVPQERPCRLLRGPPHRATSRSGKRRSMPSGGSDPTRMSTRFATSSRPESLPRPVSALWRPRRRNPCSAVHDRGAPVARGGGRPVCA
jgi:hypothetical protein